MGPIRPRFGRNDTLNIADLNIEGLLEEAWTKRDGGGLRNQYSLWDHKCVYRREGPLRVQKIENFGSSQNRQKSIGIDQESIFSHFGIIKTPFWH